ncbi:DUF3558 domain-containing protein [Amycolatopsis sp. cg5]|uniref:DUF3558 domain-containing protein n=1 Tax=Amycolatopsis sp. cg5 TaxID=3238802 RepID=UPI0035263321
MRSWRIVLISALALVSAGCSSDEKPAAAPKPTPSKAVTLKEPCAVLAGDAVGKAIERQSVTGAPGPDQNTAANGGKAKTCVYSAEGKQVGALAVTRYDGNKVKPDAMIASIKEKKPGARDVSGLAEGALYYVEEAKTATLVAAKVVGGVPILVSYSGPAKMTVEQMTPLVKQAIDAEQ